MPRPSRTAIAAAPTEPTLTPRPRRRATPKTPASRRRTARAVAPLTESDDIKRYQPEAERRGSGLVPVALMAVIIVLVIGGIGWALWQQYQVIVAGPASGDGYEIPLGIPLDQEQAPQDPTADWPAYRDNETEFSLKYPKDWALVTVTTTPSLVKVTSSTTPEVELSWQAQATTDTIEQYLARTDRQAATSYEGGPSVEVSDEQVVTIGGLSAVLRIQKLLAADLNQAVAYIPYNDSVVRIAVTAPTLTESAIALYNQMLNTFTPLLPESATSTATTTPRGTATTSTATTTR